MTDSARDVNSLVQDVVLKQTNLSVDKIDKAIKDVMSSRKYTRIDDKNFDDVVKDVISRLNGDESEDDDYVDVTDYDDEEKPEEKSPTEPSIYDPYKFLDDGLDEIIKNSKDTNLKAEADGYINGQESINKYILEKVKLISKSSYKETHNQLVDFLRSYIDEFGGEDITNYLIYIFLQNPKLFVDICISTGENPTNNLENYKSYVNRLFIDQDFLHELAQLEEKRARRFLSLVYKLIINDVLPKNSDVLRNTVTILRRRVPLRKPQEIEEPDKSELNSEEQPEKELPIKPIGNVLQQLDADPDKFRIYCRSKMSQIVQYNHLPWFEEFFRKNPKQIKYLSPKDQRVEYQRAAVESDPSVINDIALPDFKLSKEVIAMDYMLLGSIIRPKITVKAGIEIIPDPTPRLKGTIPVSLTDEQKVELMFMAILKCLADTDILSRMVHFTENDRQEFISKMFFGIPYWKELIQKHLESLMRIVFKKMGKQGLWCFMTFLNKALGINLDEQEIIRFMVRNS